jgi:hypothetical protein
MAYAFTETQKVKLRAYAGRSELNRDLDPKMESIMNALSAEAGAEIVGIMALLVTVETRIGKGLSHLVVKEAEGAVFAGEEEMESLRKHGRYLIGRICNMMNIVPYRDYFDASGGASAMGGLIELG